MKINWDKVLWSWPVMFLNALCFAVMLYIFANGCRETRLTKEKQEAEIRKKEIRDAIITLKKDSL